MSCALVRSVYHVRYLLKGVADLGAELSELLLDLFQALGLGLRKLSNRAEYELLWSPVSFLTDFPPAVGTQCIASDDENIELCNGLAGILALRICRCPVFDLRVEVRNIVPQERDKFLPPSGGTTCASEKNGAVVQCAVFVDLHVRPTFLPIRAIDIAFRPLQFNYTIFYVNLQHLHYLVCLYEVLNLLIVKSLTYFHHLVHQVHFYIYLFQCQSL